MSLKRFKKIAIRSKEDKQLDNLQTNIEEALNPIINSPIVDGVLVKKVCLDPLQPTVIQHKLGRAPLGWIVVRKRNDSRIWDIQDANTNPKRSLALTCSHACTVDLWIF